MISGFKDFVLRGNVIDLAVAVVIGAAFTKVVNAMVEGLINPLIAAVGGEREMSGLNQTIGQTEFGFGDVLGAIVNFLIVAAVVYFFIVTPVNRLFLRMREGEEAEPKAVPADVQLLTEIRDLLREHATPDGAAAAPDGPAGSTRAERG
ncbi:large conductance mechanosensitive channel protein MscL [Kineococcus xinjiangensis]|uniref:large conductance mechanosensitive channel protein MscL n=1 Tax=Kineococcus xinjiangensis TaxID=512762 RepID=UPI000CEBA1D1